jgi:photosystem II stability/assembly factor-like uncharacterized protein
MDTMASRIVTGSVLAELMLLCAAGPASGQEWVQQSPLPADNHVYNVHFRDAQSGWLVGQDGIFMRTVDGGATWTQSASFPRNWYDDPPVRNLQFVDAQRGFAAGDHVYRTTDGGETWQDMGYHGTAARMVFVSAQVGFIVGNSGLRRTVDGGQSFETVATASDVAFIDENNGVYVGSSGVFGTSDGGETWAPVSTKALGLVEYLDANVLIGVKNGTVLPGDHAIYRSDDGGATWKFVFADNSYEGSRYLTDIARIDEDSVAAVDVNGAIWVSDDAGLTWDRTNDQIGEFYNYTVEAWGVHFATPTTGYAAGGPGVVLKSTDGGASWELISNGATFDLYDVEMHESGFGIAVGDDLGILRTADFGRKWIPGRADTTAFSYFKSVQIIDEDTAVACGVGEAWDPQDAPAVVYRTDDGGHTWERRGNGILPRNAWSFEDVHFIDEDHGWLFGQTIAYPIIPAVFATTDGGLNWVRVDDGSIGSPLEGQMHDAQRGWFTSGGALWGTKDNWALVTQRTYPVAYGSVEDIEFADENTGWMVGRWGEVLRTANNAFTFVPQSLPGFDISYDLVFDLRTLSRDEALIATWHSDIDGDWGRLYRTTDGGESWVPLNRISSEQNDMAGRIYALDAFADGAIWAMSSEDGYIWATNVPAGCAADFNGDGVADRRDLLGFRNAWNRGDDRADFDGDGTVDREDMAGFLDAWRTGCP